MGANLIIDFDEDQKESFTAFLEGLSDRLNGPSARDQIIPILKEHLDKLVEREREILEPHNKSGALSASLTARAGAGDYANTVSVFSTATATNMMLQNTWGLRGRMQQKTWAANLKPTNTRKRVFYGAIVHQGHGEAEAIPFADEASEALGDQAAEDAATDILKLIMPEGDNG